MSARILQFDCYESAASSAEKRPSFDGGSGGGDNGGMEFTARIANLETGLTEVKTRLDGVETRLDRVEVRLEHIDREVTNTKWWILGQIVTGLLTVIGTGIAIQQMTVATFQAAGAQAAPAQPTPIVIQVPAAPTPAK